MNKAWKDIIEAPVGGRSSKPRIEGLTMIIDKGLGLSPTKDMIQTAGEYIDFIKLAFGTSAFYDEKLLREKTAMITAADIDVMPGGTFLEVAVWKGVLKGYLKKAKELGFSAIEVSDGTIEIDNESRKGIIRKALDIGFKVITEVGKKDPAYVLPLGHVYRLIKEDLETGAFKVIIEAREAGKEVGIFNHQGNILQQELNNLIAGVDDINTLIWEAPMKKQQQELILLFGNNVNLGNIPPDEILALEALRQGLRGDTLKNAYEMNKNPRK